MEILLKLSILLCPMTIMMTIVCITRVCVLKMPVLKCEKHVTLFKGTSLYS